MNSSSVYCLIRQYFCCDYRIQYMMYATIYSAMIKQWTGAYLYIWDITHSLTLTHSCPWSLVRHGPTTSLLHFSRSRAVRCSSGQVHLDCRSSASRPRRQVFLGRPTLLLPCGFQWRAWCWMQSPRRRVWPIQRHRLCLISSSTACWFVALHRSSLRIVSGQNILRIRRRHLFTKVWTFFMMFFVTRHVSDP